MAKIYQFPDLKKARAKREEKYDEATDKEFICHLMDTLILTYEQRIDEMEEYKKEITKENGIQLKSPKEMIKKVKCLQQMLLDYGVTCNFFRFYTLREMEIIYYNETSLVYVMNKEDHEQGMTYTTGEFIQNFEGYPFTLNLDQDLFNVFDKQINELRITINTLKNTQV